MVSRKALHVLVTMCVAILVTVESGLITQPEIAAGRNRQHNSFKRPFCNAFTGCGKKRADPLGNVQNGQQELEGDDTLTDLIDLNSEPAVEDLMRQIMSQAKLWEAIQEASREIYSQKNPLGDHQSKFPITFSAQ